MSKTNPYFPQEFTHHALSSPLGQAKPLDPAPAKPRRIGALIIVTESGSREATTLEFRSVSEALGHFEHLQNVRRYQNRDMYRAEPDGVHFHNILVLDTQDPDSPAQITRSVRVVTPSGLWTDTVAHLWVTEGDPHWITTYGDYSDDSQPVVNYDFA